MNGRLSLVTGFPKLFARRMAETILAHTPDSQVVLLAPEEYADEAQAFADTLPAGRARTLIGDVAAMHLGLSTSEYRELAQECTDIVHAAERSLLGAGRLLLERVNVEGTRAVLDLAQDCRKLRRLTHVSTAFVSGDRLGVVAEDELSAGQSFRNDWEATRFEAELLVHAAMGRLPCTVLRPGVVACNSNSGWIRTEESALAMALVTSLLFLQPPLPGDGVAPLHLVPLDFVVAAAAAIHHDARAVGRTFHLVDPNPSSLRRVHDLVAQHEGRKQPRLTLGSRLTDALLKLPGLEPLTREQRMAVAGAGQLTFFSCRNTLEILDGTGVRCPPVGSYLGDLIHAAREANKKREPSRDPGRGEH